MGGIACSAFVRPKTIVGCLQITARVEGLPDWLRIPVKVNTVPIDREQSEHRWNSDCFVRVGSHCSCHTAGPFLTHIRWPAGTGNRAETPISLFGKHLRRRCGPLLVPDSFFLAVASLRLSASEALRGNVQYKKIDDLHLRCSCFRNWCSSSIRAAISSASSRFTYGGPRSTTTSL